MKRFPILCLTVVFCLLLFSTCKKNQSTDERKPVPTAIDPNTQPVELNKALLINGTLKGGNMPPSINPEDVSITISVPSASITKVNFLFLPFAFNVKTALEGIYLQVEGANEYWQVPVKLVSVQDNSAAIAIGLPAHIKEGNFKLIYKLYSSNQKISAQGKIDVTIEASESVCVSGGSPRVDGEDGITVKTLDFGDTPGTVEISYYMYTQPDRMDIRYNGKWIRSTSPTPQRRTGSTI